MRNRYVRKAQYQKIISNLAMMCIMAQIGNPVALAATNKDLTSFIGEVGNEIVVTVEEETVEETSRFKLGGDATLGDFIRTRETNKTKQSTNSSSGKTGTVNKTSKKDTYSYDKMTYYGAYSGKPYETTKAIIAKRPELQKDIEDYFGYNNIHPVYKYSIQWNDDLWTAYTHSQNSLVRKALNSKKMRLELGDIAVKHGLVNRNDTKASAHIALFTYFGIINDEDGLIKYKNGTKDYLTRQQAATLLFKFMHPMSYLDSPTDARRTSYTETILGEDNKYEPFVENYEGKMLLGNWENGFTKEEIESPMTRMEFIWMVIKAYFPDFLDEARRSKTTSADLFTDIKKSNLASSEKISAKLKLMEDWNTPVPGSANKEFRYCLENKLIPEEYDAVIEAAYELGMLKPDSKGRANLWKNITMSQALRMLIDAAEGSLKAVSQTK